jgi:preprotein translocase subunit SecD
MNRYPTWLNLLVLGIVLFGSLLALPNIYGSAPAVQLSQLDGQPFDEGMVGQVVQFLEQQELTPSESFIEDGRVVITFASENDQQNTCCSKSIWNRRLPAACKPTARILPIAFGTNEFAVVSK